jgi:hypothetical protein
MNRLIPTLALVLLAAAHPRCASADTTLGFAINSLPYRITHSGVYHFTRDLVYTATNGTAIDIAAPDVFIDMNGFELITEKGSATTANGFVCENYDRITIENGTILGFLNAVSLAAQDASVTNLLVTSTFRTGINVVGDNANITCNRVNLTGGSTASGILAATGISLTGTYGNISNNQVEKTYTADATNHYSAGIDIRGCANVVVSNNHILEADPVAPSNAISSTGILTDLAAQSTNLILLGNVVTDAEVGFNLSGGASGSYGDNTTSSTTTGYYTSGSGMTNIGNNN